MFTGLVRALGRCENKEGARWEVSGRLNGLKVGDSLAVEGVCLTIVSQMRKGKRTHWKFDISEETVRRTTLGTLSIGDPLNLEPAARLGDSLGGHIVQGHIDDTGVLVKKTPKSASTIYEFSIGRPWKKYLAPKGAVAVDGVGLTVVEAKKKSFTVAVIPHTARNTTLGAKKKGDPVNLEFDILAKYVEGLLKAE